MVKNKALGKIIVSVIDLIAKEPLEISAKSGVFVD